MFFTEPSDSKVISSYVKIDELKQFLDKKVNTTTNNHITNKDLDWIFTITHEDDYFISGDKKTVKNFISFFKDANCTLYTKIEKKWTNKK